VTDFQKARVYAAEQAVRKILDEALDYPMYEAFGSTVVVPSTEKRFGNLGAVQVYIDLVLAHEDVQRAYPVRAAQPIKVRHRKGNRKAHYSWGEIAIHVAPRLGDNWAMREIVVLHEIAHHLAFWDSHGPAFVGAFEFLIRTFMGPEAALIFAYHCHLDGVKVEHCGCSA
jgi:putative metallohydrolase (TIGR04338 family)